MTTFASILWAAVAALCAVGFGVVTGIFHPEEKVNGLWLVVAAACFYVLAYRFYGRFLARRVVELDNRRITPAHRLNDGANFHPTNRWVLFGHHFAAIAGAGPLLGPVLAAQFGYLPGFLWLVVGAVLAGAVQDFIILVASMRRNGRSLPQIARDEIGTVTGLAAAIAVLFPVSVVVLLGVGVIVMAPPIEMPRATGFIAGGGPIIPGPIFPFVFITIACGAISGFHSLVASGTTPKMIDRESHALVGYGAMLMEGFVGVIALIAASLLAPGDYFAINTTLSAEALGALGYAVAHIQELSRIVEQDFMGRPGGAVSLAVGMASIFSALPGMAGLMAYWYQFALLFEALFILTTIDAGTRVARYLVQELGGTVYAPLRTVNWMPGGIGASLLVVGSWGYLLATGSVSTIWPMFGAANQLLGTLALCVGTTVLIKMDKARYLWVTAVPMVFVGVITLSGSYELFVLFVTKAGAAAIREAAVFYLDAALVGIVAALAVVILADSVAKWYGFVIQKKPFTTSEVTGGESGVKMPAGPCC